MAVAGSTEGFFAYSFAYYHLVFLSNVNCLCGFARPGTIASVFTEWVSVLMAFGVFSDIVLARIAASIGILKSR